MGGGENRAASNVPDELPRFRGELRGPRFDAELEPGGYRFWHLYGRSDDGRHGIAFTAFLGAATSLDHRERARGRAAIDLALYGTARHARSRTERRWTGSDATTLELGTSRLSWEGDCLVIRVEETTTPLVRPLSEKLRGTIRLWPELLPAAGWELAPGHRWWPVAPMARIEVEFENPSLRWNGRAYHDANAGDRPLASSLSGWNRSHGAGPTSTVVCCDVDRIDGSSGAVAALFDHAPCEIELPPLVVLPRTRWGLSRTVRADEATLRRTLEDTPFHARSVVDGRVDGEPVVTLHERLSLDRYRKGWARLLPPFRRRREG